MVYIPKRTFETAEISEAIVNEKKFIKPILKKTSEILPPNNNNKKYLHFLLYLLIFMLLCKLLT